MALDITHPAEEKRPIGVLLVGALLVAVAGWLLYMLWQQAKTPIQTTQSYDYTVKQSIDHSVQYFQSSFFDEKPGSGDDAYITKLTRQITPTFTYSYAASRDAQLSYYHSVEATIRASYILPGDSEKTYTVWKKAFPLIKPAPKSETTRTIAISRTVTIPFADYKKEMDDFKTGLGLPTTCELEVVFVAKVDGVVDGTQFNDTRTQVIKAPLDQDIYKLSISGVKDDKKDVVTQQAKDGQQTIRLIEKIAAASLFLLGLSMLVYGMRKQIFKTPYQRELDRIFRYHDGIIIRANRSADLKNKNVVPVKTFDDMLNLEEELKSPIVACPAGSEATQFVINHNDVLYMYTLGRVFVDSESLHAVETSLNDEIPLPPVRTATKKSTRRKVQ